MSFRWIAPLALVFAMPAAAQLDPPAWTRPISPFHVVGPIWYVGTEGLAAYLIRTRDGAILLDGTMAENVPAIERNLASLGVAMRDVKLLLNSHAHFDHAAGLAKLKADSGARLAAGIGDREALETGIPPGETSYGVIRFPPVRVDRTVRDGEQVRLGEVVLTAHATPGHTPGDTTWSMRVGPCAAATPRRRSSAAPRSAELARLDQSCAPGVRAALDVVFMGSLTVAGNRLVGNRRYPGIVADFRRSFRAMAALPADVVLPAHPEVADVIGRGRREAAGDARAFVAPGLLARLTAEAKAAFEVELAKQAAAGATGGPTRQ